jgi:hypothetical protein
LNFEIKPWCLRIYVGKCLVGRKERQLTETAEMPASCCCGKFELCSFWYLFSCYMKILYISSITLIARKINIIYWCGLDSEVVFNLSCFS